MDILRLVRVIACGGMAVLVGTCGYLAYANPAPDSKANVEQSAPAQLPSNTTDPVQKAIDDGYRVAPNVFHRIAFPCPPFCHNVEPVMEYIAKLNDAEPIKAVSVKIDKQSFQRAMSFTSNSQLVRVR
jgi:hypothetical protein